MITIFTYEVIGRYETGLARIYKVAGLEFEWTDWVLCEIAWDKGNPIHYCMASLFRFDESACTANIWNPGYDSYTDTIRLDKMHYFKPIRVLLKSDAIVTGRLPTTKEEGSTMKALGPKDSRWACGGSSR